MVEGHSALFGQAPKVLREQRTYPVNLYDVRKEVKILEAAFSQVSELDESKLIGISQSDGRHNIESNMSN